MQTSARFLKADSSWRWASNLPSRLPSLCSIGQTGGYSIRAPLSALLRSTPNAQPGVGCAVTGEKDLAVDEHEVLRSLVRPTRWQLLARHAQKFDRHAVRVRPSVVSVPAVRRSDVRRILPGGCEEAFADVDRHVAPHLEGRGHAAVVLRMLSPPRLPRRRQGGLRVDAKHLDRFRLVEVHKRPQPSEVAN
jgi:hypothetical protein